MNSIPFIGTQLHSVDAGLESPINCFFVGAIIYLCQDNGDSDGTVPKAKSLDRIRFYGQGLKYFDCFAGCYK